MGMPPSVASLKLPITLSGATKNKPSHSPMERFSKALLRKEHEIARAPPNPWHGRESQSGLRRIVYGKQTVNSKSLNMDLGPMQAKTCRNPAFVTSFQHQSPSHVRRLAAHGKIWPQRSSVAWNRTKPARTFFAGVIRARDARTRMPPGKSRRFAGTGLRLRTIASNTSTRRSALTTLPARLHHIRAHSA